ncbi:uncharacterized protein LOC105797474 [Gossypium raimondii]|uniref:uncharacterized protein LOC105797474 n=1 Tax=Gossypium raimondii TaxID=29730 RepID=UPI00063ACC2B|nr:uncharacterized protein LOC105797474 [Gossypium raimondii]
MAAVNSIRLLGEQFSEARIVEKVMSTLPERYEAKISSLEDSRDLTTISLTELINALPKPDAARSSDQPYRHCKRAGHPEDRCWFRPDAKQTKAESISVRKAEARVAEEINDQEEQVFAVSCAANQKNGSKGWLLDSGCTNHMSPNATIFKTLDKTCKTKVKIGNGQFINAEKRGDVLICTLTGSKIISNVLLVPEIDRNLLSITQLLEKGYSVVFKEKECQIFYPSGSILITVTMNDKYFEVD